MSVTRLEPFRDPFREVDWLMSMAASRTCTPRASRLRAARGLLHAGIDREDIDQAGDTQDPADLGCPRHPPGPFLTAWRRTAR
jgi:hypothetical protein